MQVKYVSGYAYKTHDSDKLFESELEYAVSQIQGVCSDLQGNKHIGKIYDIKCWGVSNGITVNHAVILWEMEKL